MPSTATCSENLGRIKCLKDPWMPGAISGFRKALRNATASINATLRACGTLTDMPTPQKAKAR